MEDDFYAAMKIDAELLRSANHYSYEEQRIRMLQHRMQEQFEREYLSKFNGRPQFSFSDEQRAINHTSRLSNADVKQVTDALDFPVEALFRIVNVEDIVELSNSIRSAVVHGVHMKYERQQNHLDIYFEKAQDYVLVKMFTE